MATKSYKIRLDLRPDQPTVDSRRFENRVNEVETTQRFLRETLDAFNQGVDYLACWLLRMHRGAGVCREKECGVWGEWKEITTLQELDDARNRHAVDPRGFALLENRELLETFKKREKSDAEAVELAECCRRIAKQLCPPNEDSSGAQMPRDSLYLLLDPHSRALGLREGPTHQKWLLWDAAKQCTDAEHWQGKLKSMPEMIEHSAKSASKGSKTKDSGPR